MKKIGTKIKSVLQGPILIFIAGLFLICFGIIHCVRGVKSWSWQSTPGIVTISHTKKFSSGYREYYHYYFSYKYKVNNKRFTGKRYSFSSGRYDSSSGVAKYKVNDKITVYYNPADPNQSTIVSGPSWFLLFPLIGGMIFALGGFFWMKAMWEEENNPE